MAHNSCELTTAEL